MSIFFNFKVSGTGRRFRKAVDQDKTEIESIWNRNETENLFNVDDIGFLIERSILSICMINEDMKVLGLLSLTDHPNVPALDPAHWEMWVRNMFQKFYLARDTLFIEFICCDDTVEDFFLEEAIISVFLNDFYLKHIVLVVSPACNIQCVDKYPPFKKRAPLQYCSKNSEKNQFCYHLYVAERQDFCPKMKIRRAVEEDNDDVVEILNEECPQLRDMYGEFYISEIISRHPESQRTALVCEIKDKVAGVMSLNADVNYTMLQSTYELGPYNGLFRPTIELKEEMKQSNELLTNYGDPILLGQLGPFDQILMTPDQPSQVTDDVDEPSAMKINMPAEDRKDVERPKKTVRHSGIKPVTHDQDIDTRQSWDESQDYSLSLLNNSISILLGEEDPFEYDIVNIDAELMQAVEFSWIDLGADRIMSSDIERPRYSIRRSSAFKKRSYQFQVNAFENMPCEYKGEPNCFVIELLGLQENVDVRQSFDLLEAAFECLPQFEYCIIRVPCADKSLFLLQHFAFVPTKPNVCSKYALYIAHRNSVLGKIRVRAAEIGDIPQIAIILHNLDAKETLWTVEYSIAHPRRHFSFVFLCGCSIIGVGILEPPEDIQLLREELSMEAHHIHKYHQIGQGATKGFASLKSALVYPVFEPHFQFFVRELMRQSGSSALIWLTSYRNRMLISKANSLVSAMIPLAPRKGGMEFYTVGDKQLLSFNAWLLNKKMSSVSKMNINCRIVVIGGSRTAMGFLNTLLFDDTCSYLTFTNVTLVSPNGLPYSRHFSKSVEMMFPLYRTSRNEFIKCTPYTYYVNVIHGHLIDINKVDKYIKLDTGKKLYYDLLFLLFGEQYQHPDYMSSLIDKSTTMKKTKGQPHYVRMDVPRQLSDVEIDHQCLELDTPDNVFIINSAIDATRALNFVKALLTKDSVYDAKILVYGATIHAYCCISALMDVGVAPENIIFAEPFPPEEPHATRVPVFCNVSVDSSVKEIIDSLRIQTYRGFYFQSWKVNEAHLVTNVELLSYFELVNVECSAFFYYAKRAINAHAFVAVQKSGLAYDGGVLIDHQFRTNNPSIYAAGTATKYYRRYYADDMTQGYYDSYEVGAKLGEQIKAQLDPMFNVDSHEVDNSRGKSKKMEWKLPELKMPLTWYCTLPGGLNYLEVRPPGKKFPCHYVQSLHFNGVVLETFKHGYFKLHMTKEFVVDGITCLTPEPYALENFKSLYGLPGVVLNYVHLRYSVKKIDDFYDYFTAPWAAFLYHENVGDLMSMVKELRPKDEPDGQTIQELLRHTAMKQSDTNLSNFSKILRRETKFEKSQFYATIADYVMEWLAENDSLMPMYLQPWQVLEFQHDLGGNPAFKRRRRTFRYMLKEVIKNFPIRT